MGHLACCDWDSLNEEDQSMFAVWNIKESGYFKTSLSVTPTGSHAHIQYKREIITLSYIRLKVDVNV